jgi:hypothetical protein
MAGGGETLAVACSYCVDCYSISDTIGVTVLPKTKAQKQRDYRDRQREDVKAIQAIKDRQERMSGHPDLPADPLGWCLGHGHITRSQYDAGRLFCQVYCTVFKKPFPACVSMEVEKRGHHAEESVYDRECKAILDAMTKRLKRHSRQTYDAVCNAAVYERLAIRANHIQALRHGLELIEDVNSARVAA